MDVQGRPTETLSPEVIQLLVGSHRQFLAFLEKRVESRAVAEDILQDAFVRTIERGSELRSDENAVAWFYRVLRNAVIDHYRRRGAAARAMEIFGQGLRQNARLEDELRSEICGCIVGLLDSLKREYKEALSTVDLADGSMEDLAARANISVGNAAVRVHRAREALRQRIRRACGTCADHGCLDCQCKAATGLDPCRAPAAG